MIKCSFTWAFNGQVMMIFFFFSVVTVIESASDFFSGRLTKKERKATLADELLSDHSLEKYRLDSILVYSSGGHLWDGMSLFFSNENSLPPKN